MWKKVEKLKKCVPALNCLITFIFNYKLIFRKWVILPMLSDMPGKKRLLFSRVTKRGITTQKKGGGEESFVLYT